MKNCRLHELLYNNKIILFDEVDIESFESTLSLSLAIQKLFDLITFDI